VIQKIEGEWIVPELIPENIRSKYQFPSRKEVLKQIHYPDNKESLKIARKVLKYEELYIFGCLMQKKERRKTILSKNIKTVRIRRK